MPAVRIVQQKLGWEEVADEEAHVFWTDTSSGTDRLIRLRRPQVWWGNRAAGGLGHRHGVRHVGMGGHEGRGQAGVGAGAAGPLCS